MDPAFNDPQYLNVSHQENPPILAAAIGYCQLLKWPVFPVHSVLNGNCTCGKVNCSSPGKHPRTFNGLKAATTDKEMIINWWKKWPNANIGVPTGNKSGFFVLDIDTRHNGLESLDQLTDRYGKLPDTVAAITGSKGYHFLFKHCRGVRNKVNLVQGIDIRGEGGYIIVSPSSHISGCQYEWVLSSHPLQIGITDSPKWLLDMVLIEKRDQIKAKSSSYWLDIIQGLGEGQRNNAAASLAGYLLKRYIDPYLVVEILRLWNERNRPPLDPCELETIINSIAGKELVRRRCGKTK